MTQKPKPKEKAKIFCLFTRWGHDDKLVWPRDRVVMDLDGDAAACPRHPSKVVELAA
uniref:Putative bifunctional methylthioribulose-1-phosphate dehydratase/enolase-phosphatase E1 n=1 Tax=Rhizophora mucronata TaxID=61149 RepID=A0A2P2JMB8_RHIMU